MTASEMMGSVVDDRIAAMGAQHGAECFGRHHDDIGAVLQSLIIEQLQPWSRGRDGVAEQAGCRIERGDAQRHGVLE
ncbi:MAG: hypothetical protein NTZ14_14705 [Hyphomicrobiales bacterium]|nr:hypothetical protein [Hyphomicrobiales bacterium]